jgi:hypothetical protein
MDDRLYSQKPQARNKRFRYCTDEGYRLDQNRRTREWRSRKVKDEVWKRYELVRVMLNNKRAAIRRTEAVLASSMGQVG